MATPRKKPEELLKRGRPTDYRPEYCDEMLEYFSKSLYKKGGYGKQKELEDLPTFEWYAAGIRGVARSTLNEWASKYPEFSEAYKKCKEMQQNLLVQGGISRAYDSGFTRFILNSVSDTYKERVTVDVGEEAKGIVRLAYGLPEKKE
jgi:hypothetical protein